MECDLVKTVSASQIIQIDALKELTKMLPLAQKLEIVLKRWQGFPITVGSWGHQQFILNAYLDYIKDIEPLLEFLEVGLDINFDATEDTASAITYRKFTARDCPWIRVDANLRQDGPGCRKVIKGYTNPEPEPIYEIECLAEVDAPESLPAPETLALANESPA